MEVFMAKSNFWTVEKLSSIIEAAVLLAIGVLFCFCTNPAEGSELIGYIIGASAILAGVIFFVVSLVLHKALFSPEAFSGALFLSFGIMFVVNPILGGQIMEFGIYFLIVLGAAIFGDAFLRYFVRKNKALVPFIVSLVVGAIALTLGILLLTIEDFKTFTYVVLGVILILYAVFTVLSAFLGVKSPIGVEEKEEEKKEVEVEQEIDATKEEK